MDAISRVESTEMSKTTDSITKSKSTDENPLRSADAIEPVEKKHSNEQTKEFNVQNVYSAFVASLREPNNSKSPIGTQDYINGYRELLKFFDQLGYVFKFVKDDVVSKLTILQAFVDSDSKETPHYDTVQKAIDYETEQNLIKKNAENFPRTLLRLHRALIFIEEFLRGLSDRPASDSAVSIATNAYDSTLYHHHGFLIRTTVRVGFRALPSRKQLEEILFHGHKTDTIEQYHTFIATIKQIYDTIDNFYAEKNYLQLP